MRVGTAASLTAHALLIGWGLFSVTTARPLDMSAIEAIPVSVEIDKVTSLPKSTPVPTPKVAPTPPTVVEAKPAPKELPPLPKPPAAAPPAPAVVAKADTTPPPAPKMAPVAAPAPAPAPAPKAAPEAADSVPLAAAAPPVPPKPRVAPISPAPKPAPAKEEPLDSERLAALLDKSRPPPQPAKPAPDALALGSLIASTTVDAHMTASELDALRDRIAACWTPPPGWLDPADVRVVLVIALNQDGSVKGDPQVVQAPGGRYQQAAPESALRAVRLCAPYALPAATYEDWREVKITFDPRAMATG